MINFQDFGFEDNEKYLSYLHRCVQIPSDASPVNILGLKRKNTIQRGYTENLCWHKFIFGDEEFFCAPLGDWDEVDWQKTFAENVPAGTVFQFVPEYLLKIWQKVFGDAIEIEEDRDYWDYILYLDRIEKLEGGKFKPFRNAKNFFEKNYSYEVEEITPKIFEELLEFQYSAEKNLQERTENTNFAENDDTNFKFALDNWDKFNLFGFVIRVDKKIVAYSLDEKLDEHQSIGLFAKADYNFKGVNQIAYWYDAKINLEHGFLTENITDDVGEENLRFFKEHLYPLVMLKKYVVTYNPAEKILFQNTVETGDLKITFERGKISLSGKLDTNAANLNKDKILAEVDGANEIIFDLNGLKYISSSGLRILIAAMKKIKSQGGTMKLKNIDDNVKEVLEMTGFSQIFEVEE